MESEDLGWDSPVQDREQKSLPKGEYRFVVKSLHGPYPSKGDKTLGADMGKLELSIFPLDESTGWDNPIGIGYDRLIRHTSTDWKVCQFFTSIGDRKHDEVIVPQWDTVEGAHGRAIFCPETYDDKTTMKVEKYLPSVAPVARETEITKPIEF